MINKVILVGTLGKDPEIKTIANGSKVANFSMATSEKYKDKAGVKQEKTEWHNVVFWGKIVDVVEMFLSKGSRIYLEGKIQTRSYENKEGVKLYTTEILGQSMTMLGSPKAKVDGVNQEPVTETYNQDSDDLPF
jgi:single-strand DNA-binding protein